MKTGQRFGSFLAALLAFGLTLCAPLSRADLIVELDRTLVGGGLFQYDFRISNTGLADVVLVSIIDSPLADPDIDVTLTVPTGFLGSYDPGLGIVDFIGDAEFFGAGTTQGLFSFRTSASADDFFKAFEALTIDGDTLRGFVRPASHFVPESSDSLELALLGLSVLGLFQLTFVLRNQRPFPLQP